jgi:hypothetical protein
MEHLESGSLPAQEKLRRMSQKGSDMRRHKQATEGSLFSAREGGQLIGTSADPQHRFHAGTSVENSAGRLGGVANSAPTRLSIYLGLLQKCHAKARH